jgi:hypothetical protein
MDVGLHRIEALPGEGRYSVTFRGSGGAEQNTVAQINGTDVEIAPASLPSGWDSGTDPHTLLCEAIQSLDRARRSSAAPAELSDVDGGWDVMIGNVVLETGNIVTCAAHGVMRLVDGIWTCPECGARAVFAAGI